MKTFCLRKAILYQGLAFSAIFLIVTLAHCSLFFLDNLPAHGFKNARAAVHLGFFAVSVYGFMTLLSAYLLVAYCVEHFSVHSTRIRVRSVFQNKEFDASSVRELLWKSRSRDGKLVFRTSASKAVLHLHGYSKEDRVQIIRLVRRLIPESVESGWEEFCHFIALPLGEGRSVRYPNTPVATDPMSLPESARVLVTRKRCDHFFGILFLLCVVFAAFLWLELAIDGAFVLPCVVIFLWLIVRFSYPKEGIWRTNWAATPEGRTVGLSQLALPATFLLMLAFRFAGFDPQIAQALGGGAILVFCVVAMRQAHTRQKLRRERDAEEMPDSVARWEAAEQDISAAGSDGSGV